jgi:hypothetical protein
MAEETRPKLRDCPFCHTSGEDDEKLYFMGNLMIYNGGEYVSSYSIHCTGCGVSLHDEYRDELVRVWNGEPPKTDEDEE